MRKLADDIETKAEVFRIVRNFQDLPTPMLFEKIKELLPDVSVYEIRKALKQLCQDELKR